MKHDIKELSEAIKETTDMLYPTMMAIPNEELRKGVLHLAVLSIAQQLDEDAELLRGVVKKLCKIVDTDKISEAQKIMADYGEAAKEP